MRRCSQSAADESSPCVRLCGRRGIATLCSGERIFFPPIGAVLQEIELGLGSELMRGHTKAYAPYAHAPPTVHASANSRCIGHCGSVPARATYCPRPLTWVPRLQRGDDAAAVDVDVAQ